MRRVEVAPMGTPLRSQPVWRLEGGFFFPSPLYSITQPLMVIWAQRLLNQETNTPSKHPPWPSYGCKYLPAHLHEARWRMPALVNSTSQPECRQTHHEHGVHLPQRPPHQIAELQPAEGQLLNVEFDSLVDWLWLESPVRIIRGGSRAPSRLPLVKLAGARR